MQESWAHDNGRIQPLQDGTERISEYGDGAGALDHDPSTSARDEQNQRMPQQAASTNHVIVKIGIEFGAIILRQKTHKPWIPKAAATISGHSHADGRTVKEVLQDTEHDA